MHKVGYRIIHILRQIGNYINLDILWTLFFKDFQCFIYFFSKLYNVISMLHFE